MAIRTNYAIQMHINLDFSKEKFGDNMKTVALKRTENIRSNGKKGPTMNYKNLPRKLKIEQHEPHGLWTHVSRKVVSWSLVAPIEWLLSDANITWNGNRVEIALCCKIKKKISDNPYLYNRTVSTIVVYFLFSSFCSETFRHWAEKNKRSIEIHMVLSLIKHNLHTPDF